MPSIMTYFPLLAVLLPLVIATFEQPLCNAPIIYTPLTDTPSPANFNLTGYVNVSSCYPPPAPIPGWSYRGCWTEEANFRAVPGAYLAADDMTRAKCVAFAKSNGHTWAEMTYGRECFTGTGLDPRSKLVSDEGCLAKCGGSTNIHETCGGSRRATVFSFTGDTPIPPPPGISPELPTILVKTTESGQVYRFDVDATGHFTIFLKRQTVGLQHYYLVRSYDAAEAYKSNVVALTIGNVGRRSVQKPLCKKDEQACPFNGRGRRSLVQFKCHANLSSNLERCGSCDGPDCSALPNVDAVSCVKGRCEIYSCQKGYTLASEGGACVRV